MGLLGNYSVLNKTPGHFLSGTVESNVRYNFSKSGKIKNRFAGEFNLGLAKFSSIPNGYLNPYTWAMPQTSGGLASYKSLTANISQTTALLAAGISIDASLSGAVAITQAQLDQIANLVAALTATVSISQAELAAVSELLASITASMSVTDAQLGAITDMIAALSASFNLTNAANFATADIEADMSVSSGAATPLQIASAVWSQNLTSNNTSGTFGWFIQKLLTLSKFMGIK